MDEAEQNRPQPHIEPTISEGVPYGEISADNGGQGALDEKPRRKLGPAERRRRRRRKRIRLIILWSIFLLAAAVTIFCIVDIIFTILERKAAREQYSLIQTTYETVAAEPVDGEDAPVEQIDPSKWYAPYAAVADKRIDFAGLVQRNPDVCAWITIEGTTIDYPVLQATGKEVFYLSHDIDGKPSEHGTACLDVSCAQDFSDRVTLLYGHNMKDGSMFAPLYQYYRDAEFYDAGHRIHIYMDNARLTYRVVAAYEYGHEHPLYYYDMTRDDHFRAYCDTFLGNKDLKAHITQTDITPEDHILTLITSTNVRADRRLFVQAVLEHVE